MKIEECAFLYCRKLQYVEIPDDSELRIIEDYAFASTAIVSFKFPSKLTQVNSNAFRNCRKLLIVEIDDKFMMPNIEENLLYLFDSLPQLLIMAPPKLIDEKFNIWYQI